MPPKSEPVAGGALGAVPIASSRRGGPERTGSGTLPAGSVDSNGGGALGGGNGGGGGGGGGSSGSGGQGVTGPPQRVTTEEVQHVQGLIEQCMTAFMPQVRIVARARRDVELADVHDCVKCTNARGLCGGHWHLGQVAPRSHVHVAQLAWPSFRRFAAPPAPPPSYPPTPPPPHPASSQGRIRRCPHFRWHSLRHTSHTAAAPLPFFPRMRALPTA
eukprot:362183-Chlamydomonas_euryale.AAC.7